MPVKGEVPWPCAEHTDAKHRIYDLYLRRWFPILLSKHGYRSVTYAEGFAGPGVYLGGEEGSPVIALRALLETPELETSTRPVRFLFVDDDPRCTKELKRQLTAKFPQRPRPPEQMPVIIRDGTCAKVMEASLDELDAWGQPILAVLDSFGNAPVPHRLIKRLASNQSSEVIVTLKPQHFIRFVTDLGPEADEVFGGDQTWRQVTTLTDGQAKRRLLLTCYRQMLSTSGFEFLLDFEMIDKRGESLYLVFATCHSKGLEKMKEALWQVDPQYGIQFRDPRDEQNESLFLIEDPQDAPLQRLLLDHLHHHGPTRVHDLRRYALFETVYREQHVLPALERLRTKQTIRSDTPGVLRIASIVAAASATT